VREQIEALTLEGPVLRVTARPPVAAELPLLAIATAIRVFERYPVLDRLILTVGSAEISLSREEVEGLLGPEGLGAAREWGQWSQVLAQAVQTYTGARPT